jgi:hypothetical protein
MIVTIGILIACVFVSVRTANKTGVPNEMPPPMPLPMLPPAPHQPLRKGKAPNARFTQLERLSMCECIIRHLPIDQDDS